MASKRLSGGSAFLPPVEIALEQMEVGSTIRFSGIDLESGARVIIDLNPCQGLHGLSPGTSELGFKVLLGLTLRLCKPGN